MATEDDSEWLLRKPPPTGDDEATFELSFLEVSLQQIWCSQSPFRITSVELLAPITQFCAIQATLVIGIGTVLPPPLYLLITAVCQLYHRRTKLLSILLRLLLRVAWTNKLPLSQRL